MLVGNEAAAAQVGVTQKPAISTFSHYQNSASTGMGTLFLLILQFLLDREVRVLFVHKQQATRLGSFVGCRPHCRVSRATALKFAITVPGSILYWYR